MSDLIEQFIKEHNKLIDILEKAWKLGIASSETKEMLLNAKTLLINHLKKEDEKLYPVLNKAAETNKNLATTIAIFASEMDKITKNVLSFYEELSKSKDDFKLSKSFGEFFALLKIRIRREENILYKEYKNLVE